MGLLDDLKQQADSFRAMGTRQEAMRTTTTRTPWLESDSPAPLQPTQAKMEDANDPTKSFIGNFKSIFKR